MGTVVNEPRDDHGRWTTGGGMDHGMLNVPLSKRGGGDINSQLDRYKASQAQLAKVEAKSVSEQKREDKAKAKELLQTHGPAILEKYGERFGRKELAAQLDQWAKWEPKRLISFAAKFDKERGIE